MKGNIMACDNNNQQNIAFITRYTCEDSLPRKMELLYYKVCNLQGQIDTVNTTLNDYPTVRGIALGNGNKITQIATTQNNLIANFNQLIDVVACLATKVAALENNAGIKTTCTQADKITAMQKLLG